MPDSTKSDIEVLPDESDTEYEEQETTSDQADQVNQIQEQPKKQTKQVKQKHSDELAALLEEVKELRSVIKEAKQKKTETPKPEQVQSGEQKKEEQVGLGMSGVSYNQDSDRYTGKLFPPGETGTFQVLHALENILKRQHAYETQKKFRG